MTKLLTGRRQLGRAAEQSGVLATGTILQKRYRIERVLGQGGMGNVYQVTHVRLRRYLALKELIRITENLYKQRQFEEQFEAEAQILASLNHPNLATVSDYFIERGNHYLVMEYIEGRTLAKIVELAPKNIAERRVLAWVGEICDVLEYLHGQTPPVIVRDLKPDNIMLSSQDRKLRLIDFGIAKQSDPRIGTQPIVKGVGTPEYAPLEQYGNSRTDQRSDLYALGATMLFLLTKVPPPPAFKRQNSSGLHDPRAVNPTVTDTTWAVIQRLLSLHPDGRPSSAAEVRRWLGL